MSRVADILLAQGAAAAEARQRTGQLWGGAVSQLSQIPQRVSEQKRLEEDRALQRQQREQQLQQGSQQLELGGMQLAGARKQAAEQYTVEQIWRSGLVKPDGSYDLEKAKMGFEQADQAHLYPGFVEEANKLEDSRQARKKSRSDFVAEQRDRLGSEAISLRRLNYEPGFFHTFVSSRATPEMGIFTPEESKALLAATTPEAIKPIVEGWIAASKTAREETAIKALTLAPNATVVNERDVDPATGQLRILATGTPKKDVAPELGGRVLGADGKVLPGTLLFEKDAGAYTLNGHPLPPGAHVEKAPPPRDPLAEAVAQATLQAKQQGLSDAKAKHTQAEAILAGIKAGNIPPESTGLSRTGIWAEIVEKAATAGLNLAKLETDWKATQRHYATLNGTQQTKLRQSVDVATSSLDKVDTNADAWPGLNVGPLNKGKLAAAKQGLLGQQAQSVAAQLDGQIADVTFELAVVYQGGGVPTDEARRLAAKNISDWWAAGTIHDMTNQARYNLNVRKNAMDTLGAATTSAPAAGATPAAPTADDLIRKYSR